MIIALFASWLAWRTGNVLARWSTVWIAANYLPYVAISLISDRIMYIYYFLPVVPGVATALAILLLRARLPRFVTYGFVVAYDGADRAALESYFEAFRQDPSQLRLTILTTLQCNFACDYC
jgi:hypothetical protein